MLLFHNQAGPFKAVGSILGKGVADRESRTAGRGGGVSPEAEIKFPILEKAEQLGANARNS